ncbi:MAG: hypothetical protein J4F36_05315 [Nitrosopumilaceae archaeon]|nr:hypothetical protein [Nitrosopumilaceae archaeon]
MALVEPQSLGELEFLTDKKNAEFGEAEFLALLRAKNSSTHRGYESMLSNARLYCKTQHTEWETILKVLKQHSDKVNKMASIKFIQNEVQV